MFLYLVGIGLLLLSTVGNGLLAVYPYQIFGVNLSAAVLGTLLGAFGTQIIRMERKRRKKMKKLRKRRYGHYKPRYHGLR